MEDTERTVQTGGQAPADGQHLLRLESDAAPGTEEEKRIRLLRFFEMGRFEDGTTGSRDGRLPVQLIPLLDTTRVRFDFPICLTDTEEGAAVRPLTDVFDALIASVVGEGDAAEQLRRDLFRMEAKIRALATSGRDTTLGVLWDEAEGLLFNGTNGSSEKMQRRRDAANSVRERLPQGAAVLGCGRDTTERLMLALHGSDRHASFRREVDGLISRVEEILAVDESYAPEKRDAAHVEAAVGLGGAGDIDAAALAGLLARVPLVNRLPDDRRARLCDALEEMQAHRTTLFDSGRGGDRATTNVCTTCEEARELLAEHVDRLAAFFQAYHVARLEVANRYEPEKHDAFFARFGWTDLTNDEKGACPPVFVHLMGEMVPVEERGAMFDLLASGLPVRVLRSVERFGVPDALRPGELTVTAGDERLATMALGIGGAYVLQTTASSAGALVEGLSEGLAFPGPALFSIYTGPTHEASRLPDYLRAAVALDARAVPAFSYNPARGNDWASRFQLAGNPQPEAVWPHSDVTFEGTSDDASVLSVAFTAADFLACDDRFDRHFAYVPPEAWHADMVPVGKMEDLHDDDVRQIPYILLAGADGVARRYVITRGLMAAVEAVAAHWHSIQELGGIDNSYVARRLAGEVERLEAEKQQALDALAAEHEAALDQATGAVAEAIVSQIADRLLSLPGTSPLPAAPSKAKAAPPVAEPPSTESAPAEAPVVEEEEEEEAFGFDEAYVDTPLCTSCNECTNLNGLIFAYDDNKQAYIKDAGAGPFNDLVKAAEMCPVRIIHPGKPLDPNEPNLDDLIKRAEPFN